MAGNGDIQSHQQTFQGFMSLLKFGTLVTIIATAFVIWLIAG